MMRALRALKSEYDIMPERTRVEARHRLTEGEYVKLLEENGFKIRSKEVSRSRCRSAASRTSAGTASGSREFSPASRSKPGGNH